MSFAPTASDDKSNYGVRLTRMEYPSGVAGVRLSLTEIAKRIREGGRSPSMRQFAEMVVRQKMPPSKNTSNHQAAQILLDYVIDNVRYRADPPLTEWVQGATITLCINGAPMCIPVGDCDDLVVALGSLLMAYGIPVHVIKQTFGVNDQEHVLLEFQDEYGKWYPADPTPRSPSLAVGEKAVASHEDIIDPLDPSAIGMVAGTPEAEFIGVGRLDMQAVEQKYGKVWRMVGGVWVEDQSAGLAGVSTDAYTEAEVKLGDEVEAPIAIGDSYLAADPPDLVHAVSAYQAAGSAGASVVGPAIDGAGKPGITQPLTQQAWTLNAALAAVNATSPTVQDARLAQSYAKQIDALYNNAIAAGRGPATAPSWGNAALIILGAGTVMGVGYAIYASMKKRGRR